MLTPCKSLTLASVLMLPAFMPMDVVAKQPFGWQRKFGRASGYAVPLQPPSFAGMVWTGPGHETGETAYLHSLARANAIRAAAAGRELRTGLSFGRFAVGPRERNLIRMHRFRSPLKTQLPFSRRPNLAYRHRFAWQAVPGENLPSRFVAAEQNVMPEQVYNPPPEVISKEGSGLFGARIKALSSGFGSATAEASALFNAKENLKDVWKSKSPDVINEQWKTAAGKASATSPAGNSAAIPLELPAGGISNFPSGAQSGNQSVRPTGIAVGSPTGTPVGEMVPPTINGTFPQANSRNFESTMHRPLSQAAIPQTEPPGSVHYETGDGRSMPIGEVPMPNDQVQAVPGQLGSMNCAPAEVVPAIRQGLKPQENNSAPLSEPTVIPAQIYPGSLNNTSIMAAPVNPTLGQSPGNGIPIGQLGENAPEVLAETQKQAFPVWYYPIPYVPDYAAKQETNENKFMKHKPSENIDPGNYSDIPTFTPPPYKSETTNLSSQTIHINPETGLDRYTSNETDLGGSSQNLVQPNGDSQAVYPWQLGWHHHFPIGWVSWPNADKIGEKHPMQGDTRVIMIDTNASSLNNVSIYTDNKGNRYYQVSVATPSTRGMVVATNKGTATHSQPTTNLKPASKVQIAEKIRSSIKKRESTSHKNKEQDNSLKEPSKSEIKIATGLSEKLKNEPNKRNAIASPSLPEGSTNEGSHNPSDHKYNFKDDSKVIITAKVIENDAKPQDLKSNTEDIKRDSHPIGAAKASTETSSATKNNKKPLPHESPIENIKMDHTDDKKGLPNFINENNHVVTSDDKLKSNAPDKLEKNTNKIMVVDNKAKEHKLEMTKHVITGNDKINKASKSIQHIEKQGEKTVDDIKPTAESKTGEATQAEASTIGAGTLDSSANPVAEANVEAIRRIPKDKAAPTKEEPKETVSTTALKPAPNEQIGLVSSEPMQKSATLPPEESATLPPEESDTLPPEESATLPPEESETLPLDRGATLPPEQPSASLPQGEAIPSVAAKSTDSPPETGKDSPSETEVEPSSDSATKSLLEKAANDQTHVTEAPLEEATNSPLKGTSSLSGKSTNVPLEMVSNATKEKLGEDESHSADNKMADVETTVSSQLKEINALASTAASPVGEIDTTSERPNQDPLDVIEHKSPESSAKVELKLPKTEGENNQKSKIDVEKDAIHEAKQGNFAPHESDNATEGQQISQPTQKVEGQAVEQTEGQSVDPHETHVHYHHPPIWAHIDGNNLPEEVKGGNLHGHVHPAPQNANIPLPNNNIPASPILRGNEFQVSQADLHQAFGAAWSKAIQKKSY